MDGLIKFLIPHAKKVIDDAKMKKKQKKAEADAKKKEEKKTPLSSKTVEQAPVLAEEVEVAGPVDHSIVNGWYRLIPVPESVDEDRFMASVDFAWYYALTQSTVPALQKGGNKWQSFFDLRKGADYWESNVARTRQRKDGDVAMEERISIKFNTVFDVKATGVKAVQSCDNLRYSLSQLEQHAIVAVLGGAAGIQMKIGVNIGSEVQKSLKDYFAELIKASRYLSGQPSHTTDAETENATLPPQFSDRTPSPLATNKIASYQGIALGLLPAWSGTWEYSQIFIKFDNAIKK